MLPGHVKIDRDKTEFQWDAYRPLGDHHLMSAPAGIGWGIGPQVNKFEQVSNDNHQMSVAGG